ncbi:MAG TPA: NUDIX hydrolase [Terriglobia bacterium]|nr:NUDIX hydrolase [Terriglobia bacterium]
MLYQGKVFSLRRHIVEEPGGVRVLRDVVHHPGSAVILPVFSDGRILMIRQYRLAAEAALWELPAGTMDPGETPLQTARRELAEETGYRSRRWRKLLEFYPSPGLLAERMHLFLARNIEPGVARPEVDEKIRTRTFALPQLLRMIDHGKIVDAKSLAGLLYWARHSDSMAGGSR